ncbi:hypothetical protein Tco_0859663 [Tanacetum coccineum]|uniref:Uncharacterized protein n=1 Tax=Tanacetum coccineum TaxID=301880 RepID=A0ABQ5BCM2_9ASTR
MGLCQYSTSSWNHVMPSWFLCDGVTLNGELPPSPAADGIILSDVGVMSVPNRSTPACLSNMDLTPEAFIRKRNCRVVHSSSRVIRLSSKQATA